MKILVAGLLLLVFNSGAQEPVSFLPPPASLFYIPNYPVPTGQANLINFPFFQGEAVWTPPGGVQSLFSRYQLPVGATFRLSQETPKQNINPNTYYSAQVTSLPLSYTNYFNNFSDQNYFLRGSDIYSQHDLGRGRYRNLTKALAYQATPVQAGQNSPNMKTGIREDCHQIWKGSTKEQIGNLSLKALKAHILKLGQVPKAAFENAWKYFEDNYDRIRNKDYMTVVDYSKPSTEPRLFLINLKSGETESHMVSHGQNSSGRGMLANYAVQYSNTPETKKSSAGAFLTGEIYNGKFGESLRVDGQQAGLNDKARSRAIVVHPWNVNSWGRPRIAQDTWGCFGLDPNVSRSLISKMKNGALWFVEPY